MDAQLKKGVIEMCLLSSVAEREQYGYDIIKRMRAYFPEMNESSFYVILRRLNKENALEQFPGTKSSGPPRKYYRITQKGRELLAKQISYWNELVIIVGEILSSGADQ